MTGTKAHPYGFPKPEPRKKAKARKDRQEAKVKRSVRDLVTARDGYCILAGATPEGVFGKCLGLQEWAHAAERRRSKTRGQAPEQRHTTNGSYAMCRYHHARYDGRALPRIYDQLLTDRGANGPVEWRVETLSGPVIYRTDRSETE